MCRITSRFTRGGVAACGLASRMTVSLAFHEVSLYGPAPALLLFSHALPRSLFCWLRQGRCLLDDAADIGGDAEQHEAGGLRRRQRHHQRPLVGGADQLLDVVLGEAELGDDERRRLVQLHDAMQREFGILRRHRLAGVELRVGAQVEGEGQAVAADLELLGQIADDGLPVFGSGVTSLR